MGGSEQGQQQFRVTMHTPVPDLSSLGFNSIGIFESVRGPIQDSINAVANLSYFVSHGFPKTQNVSVQGLTFQFSDNDGQIPWRHVDIVYQVNIVSDVDWISVAQLGGLFLAAGLVIAGILTVQPGLVLIGIVVGVGDILISVELLSQTIIGQFAIGAFAILAVVGGGYFVYRLLEGGIRRSFR